VEATCHPGSIRDREARAIRVHPHHRCELSAILPTDRVARIGAVTLLWFFVWLIWDLVGDSEPLTFDPVNFWAGALLFTVAVDLAAGHTRR
jgi:hypothetical protein